MFKFRKKLLAVLVSVCCIATAIPSSVAFADGEKVVTLGADLSDEQRTMILNYFGINGQSIETLTITNADEREHLAAYVPIEQIGTRTYSCAYVCPTTSGGIQVKTANLTWVTSNMIATTLSTSGVVNCDVLAAAPFAVSGTGALTGIIMAYESALGVTLDESKKDAANQELVTTATIGDHIGQDEATLIVNETKSQVIEGNVVNTGDISTIINNVTEEQDISLSDDDRALLQDLLEEISQLDYDYQEMKETLDRVNENVESNINGTPESEEDESEDPGSFFNNTDDSALGDDANIDSTFSDTGETGSDEDTFNIVVSDTYDGSADSSSDTDEGTQSETEEGIIDKVEGWVENLFPGSDDSDDGSSGENDANISGDEDDSGLNITVEDSTTLDNGTGDSSDNSQQEEEPAADSAEEAEPEATFTVNDLEFDPTDTAEPGTNVITVLSANTDLTVGNGTLTINNVTNNSQIESVSINDSTKVVETVPNEDQLSMIGGSGIAFNIYLKDPLDADTQYSVSLSDDAFELDGATLEAAENAWMFTTSAKGIGCTQDAKGTSTNDSVTGNVYIDYNEAGYAVIDSISIDGSDVTESVSLSQTEFTDNGSFQISFPQSGKATIHVTYYDSADSMNYIDEASCDITIQ